ncbi:MAG: type II secretion system F family protein [Planctomycetota bacterium]|jgi:type II secretory pathway component PulF
MAIFAYEAVTESGRLMKGTIEADSHDIAAEQLAGMGMTVNELSTAPREKPTSRIGRNELLLFNEQLAAIARAHLPLERSLRELAGDIRGGRLRKAVLEIADDLEAGAGIEETFEKRRAGFPPLYGRILEAGVRSGRLGEMLTSLNRHLRFESQTRRILWESMTYPIVVLSLAAVVLTGGGAMLYPLLRDMFAEYGHNLPVATKVLIFVTGRMGVFWVALASVIVWGALTSRLLSLRPGGRRLKERVFLSLPGVGRMYRRSLLSRLTDAAALLIDAGNDLPSALRLAGATTGSQLLAQECDAAADEMERGLPITVAGAEGGVIPALLWYSLQVSAERNELSDCLYELSETYADQARGCQASLQAVLMPLLIVLVGSILGFAIVGMFMPLVSMLQPMQAF